MKRSFWYGLSLFLLAGPVQAQTQNLSGEWQGVEDETEKFKYCPSVLRIQTGKDNGVFGVLYQELGAESNITVTFQMKGTRTASGGLKLDHGRKLDETGRSPFRYWCDGSITFTYDASQEKLTGHATYRPQGECATGSFTFYRIKLKSAATVRPSVLSSHRVSGKGVIWYADAALTKPLAAGNTYRAKLSRTTTFYLTQSYYPTKQSSAVPITIQVKGTTPAPEPTPAPPTPTPPAAKPDTLAAAPAPAAPPTLSTTPVVLPTVLFKVGTPELLPESSPALDQLATELKDRPTLKLRVAGHADKVGEPEKNQVLSEQRAEAVKKYLVKAGIAAERISTIGYGDTRPLYASPDARNRRVEVEEVK